jgi:tRNA threonylcarbamoyl adenosine modification protein (Sua5/YciO/YrdC/YwlC family)
VGLLVSDTANPDLLFQGKQRPRDKSVPLLVASVDDLTCFGRDVPEYAEKLASRHWPGALTLVVQASAAVPEKFVATDGSIALRMPAHNIALALLKALGMPVACSSANLSGKAAARSVEQLDPELCRAAALVIDGGSLEESILSSDLSSTGLKSSPNVELSSSAQDSLNRSLSDGSLGGGVASTVVSCLQVEPRVLRPGPITI